MNTAGNVHHFMTAERARRSKKLFTIEQACVAKEAPKGKPVRKTPKPKVLRQRFIHVTTKQHGLQIRKWMVYAVPGLFNAGTSIHVTDPFTSPGMYLDSRRQARDHARYLNKTYGKMKPAMQYYRVAPVHLTVSFVG